MKRGDLPTGTVTFPFTDIEGSTRLAGDLGEAGNSEALTEHRRILREAFGRHGGTEGRGLDLPSALAWRPGANVPPGS